MVQQRQHGVCFEVVSVYLQPMGLSLPSFIIFPILLRNLFGVIF